MEVKLTLETSACRRGDQCRSDDGMLLMRRFDKRQPRNPWENGWRWVGFFFLSFFFSDTMTDEWRRRERTIFKVWQFTQDWLKESVAGFDWTNSAVTLWSREIAVSCVRLNGARSLCGQTFTKFLFIYFFSCDNSLVNVFLKWLIDRFSLLSQRSMYPSSKVT